MLIILLLFNLLATSAEAKEFKVFELEDLRLVFKDYAPGGSDPLITQNGLPNRGLGNYTSLQLTASFIKYFYIYSNVHAATDEVFGSGGFGSYRSLGWEYHAGLNVFSWLKLHYIHHSQHLIDHVWPHGHFPVEDSLGFTLIFYNKNQKKGLVDGQLR